MATLIPLVGRYAATPSGLYCNLDFTLPGVFIVVNLFIIAPLVVAAGAYVSIYYHLQSLGRQRVAGANDAATRIEGALAMKMLLVTAVVVACW